MKMEYIVWNIRPELFSLGPLTVRWYGALFATGFVCGYYLMRWIYQRENKNINDLENLLLYVAAGTVIGARLGHCLFYDPVFYLSHPLKLFAIWEGGLASHGGGAGVLLAVYLYSRKTSDSYLWLLDRIAITVALAGGFIRLGNLFNSEILGKAATVPWAVIFKRVDNVPRHPVQVYESLSYFAIFIILLMIYKYYSHKVKNGFILGCILILIPFVRFLLEYVKMPQEAFHMGIAINMGQLLSIPFFVAGCVLVYLSLKKSPTTQATQ